jgi:hypothetical protein
MNWLRRLVSRLSGQASRQPRADPRPPSVPPGTSSLAGLLDALEEVAESHPELLDTDVREQLWDVIERKYVHLDRQYTIPEDLGMFSPEANSMLRRVLDHHLNNLVTIADLFRLDTEAERLRTILNPTVRSTPGGHSYDYFLGQP